MILVAVVEKVDDEELVDQRINILPCYSDKETVLCIDGFSIDTALVFLDDFKIIKYRIYK